MLTVKIQCFYLEAHKNLKLLRATRQSFLGLGRRVRRQSRSTTQHTNARLVAVSSCGQHTLASRKNTRPSDVGRRLLDSGLVGSQEKFALRPFPCSRALAVRHLCQAFGASRAELIDDISARCRGTQTRVNMYIHRFFLAPTQHAARQRARTMHQRSESMFQAVCGVRSCLARCTERPVVVPLHSCGVRSCFSLGFRTSKLVPSRLVWTGFADESSAVQETKFRTVFLVGVGMVYSRIFRSGCEVACFRHVTEGVFRAFEPPNHAQPQTT